MKTKIIYISGNEVFEMAEIRAAFDEVRSALGLDNDTILFGVPVDSDNAITTADTTKKTIESNTFTATTADIIDSETVIENESVVDTPVYPETVITETIIVDEVPEITEEEVSEPTDEIIPEPEAPTEIHNEQEDNVPEIVVIEEQNNTVVPILSILSAQDNVEPIADEISENVDETLSSIEETVANSEPAEVIETEEAVIISDIDMDTQLTQPALDNDDADAQQVTIGDMIVDDAPEKISNMEKSLEQLLESMTPLREDHIADTENIVATDEAEAGDKMFDDTDSTLAQLASEFAETEDKIFTTKNENHGKIGKLKNILPFKKMKRDDSSLMGDLFGWAGVAANDDDFSIPGFFTQARKQGA